MNVSVKVIRQCNGCTKKINMTITVYIEDTILLLLLFLLFSYSSFLHDTLYFY